MEDSGGAAPDQGLLACVQCRALNLPNSRFCCRCGVPIAGDALREEARREVEDLIHRALSEGRTAPVLLLAGSRYESRLQPEVLAEWPVSLASPLFVTEPALGRMVLESARVLVYDGVPDSVSAMVPLLESIVAEGRPLAVIADDYSEDVLRVLVVNQQRGTLKGAALKRNAGTAAGAAPLREVAQALGGEPITARELERVKAATLPQVPLLCAGEAATLVAGLRSTPPFVFGGGADAAARARIYGRSGSRLTVGGGSAAEIDAKVRYAREILTSLSVR